MKLKIYINNKGYKIDTKLLTYIGEGIEGVVYEFNGKALKLYKNDRETYFVTPTIEKIESLATLKTKHFPFPEYPVLNKDGKLIGHSAPLIKNKKQHKELLDKPIIEVIEQLKSIRNDIILLNNNCVEISECDFYRNFIYNGIFNFIDHDMYRIINNSRFSNYKRKIQMMNDFTINDFYVMNLLLDKYKNKELLKNKRKLYSKKIIEKFDLYNIYFEDLLLQKSKDENIQTINQFIKKYRNEILPKK